MFRTGFFPSLSWV